MAGLGVAIAAGLAHGARHTAPYEPVLEEITVDCPLLPPNAAPLRIGFVTDTHVGPAIRARDVEQAMSLLFEKKPDLLLLGGDYVCESPRFIPEAAAVLGDFAGSTPLGAVAVLGNHDYSNDVDRIVSVFDKHGIHVLRNEATHVAWDQFELWIAGINDALLAHPEPDRAFAQVPSGERPIALWHEPDWAEESAKLGAFLQLSGHSHGGQVRLPLVGHVAAPPGGRRFVRGMKSASGMPVYTSRGVGVYRPQIRLRCSPEVTLITLVPA